MERSGYLALLGIPYFDFAQYRSGLHEYKLLDIPKFVGVV